MNPDAPQWSILVCDKGYVLAGVVRPHPSDPLRIIIDRCQVVRRWGTTKGVGQLRLTGPTSETVLDPEGDGVEQGTWYIMRQALCTQEASLAWTRFTS